jgi:DNA-binding FadR family transcriptional regulator
VTADSLTDVLAAAANLVPLAPRPIHEICADRLTRAIHLGIYSPGDRLPSERELTAELGVSRVTLREALARLEGTGLIRRSPGTRGGTFVAAPDEQLLRAQLVLKADWFRELTEFRTIVEGAAALLAAERADSGALELLRAAIDALRGDDRHAFRRADSAFHLTIAYASGNTDLVATITDARERMFSLTDSIPYEIRLESTLVGHQAIYDAIAARKGPRARRAMEAHLAAAQADVDALRA